MDVIRILIHSFEKTLNTRLVGNQIKAFEGFLYIKLGPFGVFRLEVESAVLSFSRVESRTPKKQGHIKRLTL
jgi:hypothetical protein